MWAAVELLNGYGILGKYFHFGSKMYVSIKERGRTTP
jgi:hypothetical protein